jgi:hypothetical protein
MLGIALNNPGQVASMVPEELDLLLQLLRRVRLHGRFAAELKREGAFADIPQVAQDQLESALVMADARKRVAMWELNRIDWATRDQQGIDLICMKGCAYILLGLPNTRGRIFADADLLVAENQLVYVEQLLNRRGWKTKELTPYDDNYYRRWTHELPPLVHVERDVEIDLHHNIVPRTARLRPSATALLDNSVTIAGSRYRVLANEDLVLHAMVHLMFDSDLSDKLRDLVDIDEMCRYFAGQDENFWDSLLDRAEKLGLGRPVYYSLRYCRQLLDNQIPQRVIEQTKTWRPVFPIRWLMDHLVPRAMLPLHPQYPSRLTEVARLLLYMRSHWIRMPPWLLFYHLGYKFYATKIRRRAVPTQEAVE